MNIQETLALISALKGAGVTHFKSSDFEITLDPTVITEDSLPLDMQPPTLPEVPPVQENVEATEKIKDLISTMKMNDEELVNKIFPNGAGS